MVLAEKSIVLINLTEGESLYTWVKYADTPTSGMSDSPINKKYVGHAYNKISPIKSTDYADYEWNFVQGPQGIPGESAKAIKLVADNQIFKVDKAGTIFPNQILVYASTQNTTVSDWKISKDGGAYLPLPITGVILQDDTLTINNTVVFNNLMSIQVSDGDYIDTLTIVKNRDSESNVTGYLTNENIVFAADQHGGIGTYPKTLGAFKVYDGLTDITTDENKVSYSIRTTNSGCIASISLDGIISLIDMSADSAEIEVYATYIPRPEIKITKKLTLAKARSGINGIGILLLNEHQSVVTGQDGTVDVQQILTIPFTAYSGTAKIAATAQVETLPPGVTLISNTAGTTTANGLITLKVSQGTDLGGITSDYYNVNIPISITAFGETFVKYFSLSKVLQGKSSRAHYVDSNMPVIVRKRGGEYLTNGITYNIFYTDGDSSPQETVAYWKVEQTVDGETWTELSRKTDNATNLYSVQPIPTDIKALRVSAYEDKLLTIKLDHQTSPVIEEPNEVSDINVMYYSSTSPSILNGGVWSDTAPAWTSGRYIWTKTITSFSDGRTFESNPVSITGANGSSVDSIVEQYYLSDSKTTQVGGEWTYTPPVWSTGKYIWTRSEITYSNPTRIVTSEPILNNAWEVVADLNVGGNNLLLNSAIPAVNMEYRTARYTLSEKMKLDEDYIMRIWGTLGPGKTSFAAYLNGATVNLGTFQKEKEGLYLLKFKGKADAVTLLDSISIFAMPSSTVAVSNITKAQLQIGTFPTEWNPARQDFDFEINKISVSSLENIMTLIKISHTSTLGQLNLLNEVYSLEETISNFISKYSEILNEYNRLQNLEGLVSLDLAYLRELITNYDSYAEHIRTQYNLEINAHLVTLLDSTTKYEHDLTPSRIMEKITTTEQWKGLVERGEEDDEKQKAVEDLIVYYQTEKTQTDREITDSVTEKIESLSGVVSTVTQFFRRTISGLEISKTGSPYSTVLNEEQLAFKDNGATVAYFKGKNLYTGDLVVEESIQLGVHKLERVPGQDITIGHWTGPIINKGE